MKKSVFLYIFVFLLLANVFLLLAGVSYGVPDSDADGVPDGNDKCPNSETIVVDQFGCSCAQKGCQSDNNPCTDDCGVVDGRAVCNVTNTNHCPGGYCSHGVCNTQIVKENVECLFLESSKIQECYTSGLSEKGSCIGIKRCVVYNVTGTRGEKVTWKSSCGGYANTTMDGIDENVNFTCYNDNLPQPPFDLTAIYPDEVIILNWSNVNGNYFKVYKNINYGQFYAFAKTENKSYIDKDVVSNMTFGYYVTALNEYGESKPSNYAYVYPQAYENKTIERGFKYAKWTCYDGYTESQGSETSCEPVETWLYYANKSCEGHCSSTKCGVNSFSVRERCGDIGDILPTNITPILPIFSMYPTDIRQGDGVSIRVSASQPNSKILLYLKDLLNDKIEVNGDIMGTTDNNGKWKQGFDSTEWPSGIYRAFISVAGNVSNEVDFSVKGGAKIPQLSISPRYIRQGDTVSVGVANAQPNSEITSFVIYGKGSTAKGSLGTTNENGQWRQDFDSKDWAEGIYKAWAVVAGIHSNEVFLNITK